MSEKRYYKFLDDKQEWVIRDITNRRNEYRVGRNKGYAENIVDLLNELSTNCSRLQEENKQLRKELNDCEKFRYAVFKGMEKIIEEKKNDNGGFQVWEVPPITMGETISFTTNNDGDGV